MKSYLFLADGFEEIEALGTVDILRRGGMEVRTVSINPTEAVTGAHGVTVAADLKLDDSDFTDAEWMIIPGGLPGATNIAGNKKMQHLLTRQWVEGKIAAICASPAMVLGPLGIIDNRPVTGYPGTESLQPKAKWTGANVVVDGNLVTGRAPGAAIEFALTIIAQSQGQAVADGVAKAMCL